MQSDQGNYGGGQTGETGEIRYVPLNIISTCQDLLTCLFKFEKLVARSGIASFGSIIAIGIPAKIFAIVNTSIWTPHNRQF